MTTSPQDYKYPYSMISHTSECTIDFVYKEASRFYQDSLPDISILQKALNEVDQVREVSIDTVRAHPHRQSLSARDSFTG
ncbi:hypothetical protein INT47_009307 [Mucor saturninus]|uniref:Uncharacterized protein n=1 Tax=Mucor saturninus TaxID=64648 RepID=A0A8H7QJ83_9FUNG|nr:hypothetical protein INT47_009307 [Mucor saturninus]